MTNEGLLLTVKVFLDWLRTNTDLIIMCAQVGMVLGLSTRFCLVAAMAPVLGGG